MERVLLAADEELLNVYLSLPKEKRDMKFADTSKAADMIGRSQRTIQFWIEIGAVRAIPIGGRFKVDLDSLVSYLKKSLR